MNRSPHQSRDHELAGAGVPPSTPLVTMLGPLPEPAGPHHFPSPLPSGLLQALRTVFAGVEMASTAGTRHWVNTVPDGMCATDGVPSLHPNCLPGRSRALLTLQEWGSAVVAATPLACTLSPSRCLTPSDCAHMARTCLFWDLNLCNTHSSPCITGLTSPTRYRSEPTHASRFCSLFDASWGKCHLWCQLEWHIAHSTSLVPSLCFPLPLEERKRRQKKKKEKEMLVHCRMLLAFTFLMLWCVHQGDCPSFSIVALPTRSFVVAPVVRSKKKKLEAKGSLRKLAKKWQRSKRHCFWS